MNSRKSNGTNMYRNKIDFGQAIDDSMRAYSAYTISGRAVPDARDGLKPVQRRILYAMMELKLFPDTPFTKSARVVGHVLGKYHPHGDQAVYGAMVRMAQDFSASVPLVEGQGNFGSVDGDDAADMRYTEARLSQWGMEMLADVEFVNYRPNFDDSAQEPVVLAPRFPNLLINGAQGVAVGVTSVILPHNPGEVCLSAAYCAENWSRIDSISTQELMNFVQGPDLPLGGIILKKKDDKDHLFQAYETGESNVIFVPETSISGRRIYIRSVPFGVSKNAILQQIATRRDHLAISSVTDESEKGEIAIAVDVMRGKNPEDVLEQLYTHTDLRKTLPMIHSATVPQEGNKMRLKRLSLKEMLTQFLKHRDSVVRARYESLAAKTEKEIEKNEAKIIIARNAEALIKAIRNADTHEKARQAAFAILKDDRLVQYALSMTLLQLSHADSRRAEKENVQLRKTLEQYRKKTKNQNLRMHEIAQDLRELAKLSPKRKTKIL